MLLKQTGNHRFEKPLRFPWARNKPPHEKYTRCGVFSSSLSHWSLRVFPTLM